MEDYISDQTINPKNSIITGNNKDLVKMAIQYLEDKWRCSSLKLNSSSDISDYLKLQLANQHYESFAVLFLTNRFGFIKFEKLFDGTIAECPVYPRIVLEKVLEYRAAKVILAHNHPSSECQPSNDDIQITGTLKIILSMIGVTVEDHFIVSSNRSYSFVEHNKM